MSKEKITSLNQLRTGDQICFDFCNGKAKHHAVVTNVYADEGKYEIIHLNEPGTEKDKNGRDVYVCSCQNCKKGDRIEKKPDDSGIIVNQTTKKLKDNPFYRVNHETRLPASETKEMAESLLHRKGYNLASNNCEHFATLCVTGVASSEQVEIAVTGGLIATATLIAISFIDPVPGLAALGIAVGVGCSSSSSGSNSFRSVNSFSSFK